MLPVILAHLQRRVESNVLFFFFMGKHRCERQRLESLIGISVCMFHYIYTEMCP